MSSGERRANAADPNIRPYFFLSYARTPRLDPGDNENSDRWVHKLYKDLCDAILQMTDVQPAEAGVGQQGLRVTTERVRANERPADDRRQAADIGTRS